MAGAEYTRTAPDFYFFTPHSLPDRARSAPLSWSERTAPRVMHRQKRRRWTSAELPVGARG